MNSTATSSKTPNGHKYSLDGDSISQDLHLKMSKKIAQLTKVIYVLNTRNDDHDTVIENMTNQHKRDLRQTVSEVTLKVDELEARLNTQTGDQRKVTELQDIIRSYENLLDQSKKDLLNYKNDATEHNKRKDAEYFENLNRLNDKISSLELSYKIVLEKSGDMERQKEIEMNALVKELESRHRKEISELKEESTKTEKNLKDLLSGSQKEVEEELNKAQEALRVLAISKEKMIVDFENQVKELNKHFEEQLADSLQESKSLFQFELEEANARLQEFQSRYTDKDEVMKTLTEKHAMDLQQKDTIIATYKQQMDSLTTDNKERLLLVTKRNSEMEAMKEVIAKLESDLTSRRKEVYKLQKGEDSLTAEIELKAKQIKDLKISLETVQQKMANKDSELKEAIRRMEVMNQDNRDMEHCTKSVNVDYEIQIQTLTRGLEDLTNERIAQRQELERLHLNNEIEQGDLQSRLKNEYNTENDKLTKKFEKEWSMKEKAHKEDIQKLKDDHQARLDDERNKASKIIEKHKAESEQIKSDSNSKLKSKEKQMLLQEVTITERDKEIKAIALQNKSIKEKLSNLKKDNQKHTTTIGEKDVLIEKLTTDIGEMKESLEKHVQENERIQKSIKTKVQEDMSEKYNELSANLDKKWADTLRRETGRLRNDMLDNFAREKENMAENVERIKREEISTIKEEFEKINANLLSEISLYKDSLSKLENTMVHQKEDANKINLEQIENLENKLMLQEKSHLTTMSRIKEEHEKHLEKMSRQFEVDRSHYIEDMEELLGSADKEWKKKHESIIASLSSEHEQIMKSRMNEILSEHNREIGDQIRSVQQQMSEDNQGVLEDHKHQIKNLQQKVQFFEDQSKVQMENHRMEMEKAVTLKLLSDQEYEKLEHSLKETLTENNYLKKQMEEFSDDYHRNQKEFTEKLRQNESDLRGRYERILDTNRTNYEEDSRQTLQDFNKAQNLFKDKIKELSGKLIEMEERYQNRPSRDEDSELIATLKVQLRTSEKEVERMNEEKKFFQLELINRETNFNKIFNASPKVDATHGAIKTKKTLNEKLKNSQKLTPLPGSPFHDDPINPSRPLPPSRRSIDAS